jgi:hypothetical protein
MKIFANKTRLWLVAALVTGLLVFGSGFKLLSWQDSQVGFYNQGLAAYQSGDAKTALQFFDKSLGVYRQRTRLTWSERFFYPAANREYAALASFHKAKALLHLRQAEPAVEAFKESLRLNPGNSYDKLAGFEHASQKDVNRLTEEALVVKYDLELLFKNNKQMADGQGKGKPKPGQPGDKKQPGQQPGQQPGKGNKDEI